ncbi:MAG: internal scaffolding protein [Microviridae sp.]|nr:MAG: internal scaffolding protein [Microviridae sp.]
MFYRQHARVITPTGEHSMTKQSHKAECDINNILSQYKKTGLINHITSKQPSYSELPDELDYQNAQNTLISAQNTFAALPSKVRDHFGNDPASFLAAFNDPQQAAYLREYGFLRPLPEPSGSTPTAQDGKPSGDPS